MATLQIHQAKSEVAATQPEKAVVATVKKVGAKSGTSEQTQGAGSNGLHELDLDPDGNCRIKIFTDVPQGETMAQYPYSRCYVVQSTGPTGQTIQTSGFALSATRVLTSNVHIINIEQQPGPITVLRSYVIDDDTHFDSEVCSQAASWGDDEKEANIGLRYCMLAMAAPLTITDEEGDQVFTTITSVVSINPNPTLQCLTRRVPTAELVSGSANGAPRRVTNGSVAEWFVTDLGGWIGKHTTSTNWDYMRGSPIFVTEETGPPDGPLISRAWLVGLVTDAIVATNPCTVNAGLFVDDGAVNRLLDAL